MSSVREHLEGLSSQHTRQVPCTSSKDGKLTDEAVGKLCPFGLVILGTLKHESDPARNGWKSMTTRQRIVMIPRSKYIDSSFELAETRICDEQCVLMKLPRDSSFNAWLVGQATR